MKLDKCQRELIAAAFAPKESPALPAPEVSFDLELTFCDIAGVVAWLALFCAVVIGCCYLDGLLRAIR